MKRVFCPKCDNQITIDETKYPEAKAFALVCRACGHQFKIRNISKKPDYPYGYIQTIENAFGFKQNFPLALGDNVIGRRNKDTDGVDIEVITSDPSLGRKHCVVNVNLAEGGKCIYTLRDFPSLTGTFLQNTLLGKKEQARIEGGAVVTVGATTFILHEAGDTPEE